MIETEIKYNLQPIGLRDREETNSGTGIANSTLGVNRWRIALRQHVWRPPTDVYETDDLYPPEGAIIVRMEIAGMKEEAFSISLSDQRLIIRGVRPDIQERRSYQQMEIFFGEFMSEVDLPAPVIAEKVVAEYNNGFLRVTLPKELPQTIQVTYQKDIGIK